MSSEVDSTSSSSAAKLHSMLCKLMENQQRMNEDCKRLIVDSNSSKRLFQEMNQITNKDVIESNDIMQFLQTMKEFSSSVGTGWFTYCSDIERVLRHVYSANWQIVGDATQNKDEANTMDNLLHALESMQSILTTWYLDVNYVYIEDPLKRVQLELVLSVSRIMMESHQVLNNSPRCNQLSKVFHFLVNCDYSASQSASDSFTRYIANVCIAAVQKSSSEDSNSLQRLLEERNNIDHFELFRLSSPKTQLSALLQFSHNSTYEDLLAANRNMGNVKNNWLLASSYIQCLTRNTIRSLKYIPHTNNHSATKKLLHACIFGDGRVQGLMEVWKQCSASPSFIFREGNFGVNSISGAASFSSFLQTVVTSCIGKVLEGIRNVNMGQLNKISAKINKSCRKAISNNRTDTIEVDVCFALLEIEGMQHQVEYLMNNVKDVLNQLHAVISYFNVIQSHFFVLGPSYFYPIRNGYLQSLISKKSSILTNSALNLKDIIQAMQAFHDEWIMTSTEDDIGEELKPLNILSSILLLLQEKVRSCVDDWEQILLSQLLGIQEHLDHLRISFSNWRQQLVMSNELEELQQPDELQSLCQSALEDLNADVPAVLSIWSEIVFLIGSKLPIFQLVNEVLSELEQQCFFVVHYSPSDYFSDITLDMQPIHEALSKASEANRENEVIWGDTLGGLWNLCIGDAGAMTIAASKAQSLFLENTNKSSLAKEIAVSGILDVYMTCKEISENFLDDSLASFYADLLQQAMHHLGYCISKSKYSNNNKPIQDRLDKRKFKLSVQHMIEKHKSRIEDELETSLLRNIWAQEHLVTALSQRAASVAVPDVVDAMKILAKNITDDSQQIVEHCKALLECFGTNCSQTSLQRLDRKVDEMRQNENNIINSLQSNVKRANEAMLPTDSSEHITTTMMTIDRIEEETSIHQDSRHEEPFKHDHDGLLQEILTMLKSLQPSLQQSSHSNLVDSDDKKNQQSDIPSSNTTNIPEEHKLHPLLVNIQEQLDSRLQEHVAKLTQLEEGMQVFNKQMIGKLEGSPAIRKEDIVEVVQEMMSDLDRSISYIVEEAVEKAATNSSAALPALQDTWSVQLSEMFNSFMLHHFKDDPDIITSFEDEEYFNLDVKKMQKLMKKIAHVLSSKISNYSKHLSAKLTELVLFHNNKLMPRVDYLDDELRKVSAKVDLLIQAVSRKQYDRLATPKINSSKASTEDFQTDTLRTSTSLHATLSSSEAKVRPSSPTFSKAQRFFKSKQQQDIETEMSYVLERKYVGEGSPFAKKVRETVSGNRLSLNHK